MIPHWKWVFFQKAQRDIISGRKYKMRLTSKGRYAVRAILDLTFSSNGRPVRLQEISERQKISLHYLEQLFRRLRKGGVVKSVRGPGGGYVLAKEPSEITLAEVFKSVQEVIELGEI